MDKTKKQNQLASQYDIAANNWQGKIAALGYPAAYESLIFASNTALPTELEVLDAGTGAGDFAKAFLNLGHRPNSLSLLDISDEMLKVAAILKENGVDIINVSTGQVIKEEEPVYGRMYQVPFADQIRNDVGIATIVAGNISTADQVNTLVAAGRTDIVALARPIMNDPQFVLNAAAHYQYTDNQWPPQYISGKFAAEAKANKENAEELELRLSAKPPNPVDSLAIAIARGDLLSDK